MIGVTTDRLPIVTVCAWCVRHQPEKRMARTLDGGPWRPIPLALFDALREAEVTSDGLCPQCKDVELRARRKAA